MTSTYGRLRGPPALVVPSVRTVLTLVRLPVPRGCPRAASTSRSTSMRSATMPSTPRSRSRWYSVASSRDQEWNQTWTCLPSACAARTRAGVTRTTSRPPTRCSAGICSTGAGVCSSRDSSAGEKRSAAVPTGPAAVATPGPSARRTARMRRAENEPRQTRSSASSSRSTPRVGARAESALTSMFTRAAGKASSSSESSGTGSVPPTRASRTRSHGRSATSPVPSVTRSRATSWKATTRPSRVACTSVSR